MLIDFKEIPAGNRGGDSQDAFELFARDFLEVIGYKVVEHPDRGADSGRDLIVEDIRKGIEGETRFRYLVSCKHYATSNRSVTDGDELDVKDRLLRHKCEGFLGMYSTIISSSLAKKLKELNIEAVIYDQARLENTLIRSIDGRSIILRYFPNSFIRVKEFQIKESPGDSQNEKASRLALIEAAKTALILIEIEKIREAYFAKKWSIKSEVINTLYKFSNHSNAEIGEDVAQFLLDASTETRGGMNSSIALAIESLALSFYPISRTGADSTVNERVGGLLIETGFNLAYDGIRYLDNYLIPAYGLSIAKFVYKTAKKDKIKVLEKEVLGVYLRLEEMARSLDQDSESAVEFLSLFRNDLVTSDIAFPTMPNHLFLKMKEV